jgi:hypothetical protein
MRVVRSVHKVLLVSVLLMEEADDVPFLDVIKEPEINSSAQRKFHFKSIMMLDIKMARIYSLVLFPLQTWWWKAMQI